jgi:hypothetical protein
MGAAIKAVVAEATRCRETYAVGNTAVLKDEEEALKRRDILASLTSRRHVDADDDNFCKVFDAALMTGIHDHLWQCTVDGKIETMADEESKDVLSKEDGSDEDVDQSSGDRQRKITRKRSSRVGRTRSRRSTSETKHESRSRSKRESSRSGSLRHHSDSHSQSHRHDNHSHWPARPQSQPRPLPSRP